MSKFIKVTEQVCGEVKLIPLSDIIEICADGIGSKIVQGHANFYAKESIEQIEAQLLRDEFAKAALTALIGDEDVSEELGAEIAYGCADAMLKERSRCNK